MNAQEANNKQKPGQRAKELGFKADGINIENHQAIYFRGLAQNSWAVFQYRSPNAAFDH